MERRGTLIRSVRSPRWRRTLLCATFANKCRPPGGLGVSSLGVAPLVVLAARTLTNARGTRVALDVPRRDIFIWVCAIVFLNQIFSVVKDTPSASLEQLLSDLGGVGIFQLMAWYAIFRLLASSDRAPVTQLRDFLIAVALCGLVFAPATRLIWVAALGVGIYGSLFNQGDPKLRAAAVVLSALSVQEFWGRIFFKLFALPLLHAETAVVGTLLQAVRPGTMWQDNLITGPSGHGIAVYDGCSSFHNLSVAALCWLTVRSLRDQSWQVRDFVIGCVVGITMVLCNVARLCLMAWDADLYQYWHNGAGAQIFVVGASTAILLISLYGSRAAGRVA